MRFLFVICSLFLAPYSFILSQNQPSQKSPTKGSKKRKVIVKQTYASWYGSNFHKKKTASGKPFDMQKFTAAHKTLPFGTRIKVTNIKSGKSIVVVVNDRGPFVKKRDLDLSCAAFAKIANIENGITYVEYETF